MKTELTFRRRHCLHHQNQRISQAGKKRDAGNKKNVGASLPDYTASHPRRDLGKGDIFRIFEVGAVFVLTE
jgi:hypothetical protein